MTLHWSRAALLVVMVGCTDLLCPGGESLPAAAREVPISARYDSLWREIDRCSQRPQSIAGLRIYIIPGIVFEVDGVKMTAGYQVRHRRVLLSVWADSESSGNAIRHEFLHAHLGARDNHPPEYFGTPGIWIDGRCGRLVNH